MATFREYVIAYVDNQVGVGSAEEVTDNCLDGWSGRIDRFAAEQIVAGVLRGNTGSQKKQARGLVTIGLLNA